MNRLSRFLASGRPHPKLMFLAPQEIAEEPTAHEPISKTAWSTYKLTFSTRKNRLFRSSSIGHATYGSGNTNESEDSATLPPVYRSRCRSYSAPSKYSALSKPGPSIRHHLPSREYETVDSPHSIDSLSAQLLPNLVPGIRIGPDVRIVDKQSGSRTMATRNVNHRKQRSAPVSFQMYRAPGRR